MNPISVLKDAAQKWLAAAAVEMAGAVGIGDLLRVLRSSFPGYPTCRIVGLGAYDERRKLMIVFSAETDADGGGLRPGPISQDGEEFSAGESWTRRVRSQGAFVLSGRSEDQGEEAGRLLDGPIDSVVVVGLLASDGALDGALYLGCEAAEPGADLIAYAEAIGQVVHPAFQNIRTRDRLAKGDRRRASLIDLSHAINDSLRFHTVVSRAQEAIRGIAGHQASIIALAHGEWLQTYWTDATIAAGSDSPEPESLSATGTPFVQAIEEKRVYESGDLGRSPAFPLDERLLALGVRRYTVAPLIVQGKAIGGFLFGTQESHPALTTDVWMYENIALQLALAIENARKFEELQRLSQRLAQQNVYLQEEIASEHNVEGMIGKSDAIRQVVAQISRVAETDVAVLVTGETGVGKELVARAIHARSKRADKPLVKINCAAIPENLVESELFGHEKGAFTSATSRRLGRFELAREGTLFLDEVGELPLSIQAKLLRVLQDGEFERVGGGETLKTDARIIAATNRDLAAAAANGTFRSDLFYRLNVFPIHVPSLAERRDDIPLLVESFVRQCNRRMGKRVGAIDVPTMERLSQRNWPGNVRELRHFIERAMILSDGRTLVVEDAAVAERVDAPAPSRHVPSSPLLEATRLDEVERLHIERILQETGGVIEGPNGAARLLGLRPSTLRSRMKRLSVSRRVSGQSPAARPSASAEGK